MCPTSNDINSMESAREQVHQKNEVVSSNTSTSASGYSDNYRERVIQIRQQGTKAMFEAKDTLVKGIDEGKADPVFQQVYSMLRSVLLAPYDQLNFSILSLGNMSDTVRQKYITVLQVFSAILLLIYFVDYILTRNISSIFGIAGCIGAFIFSFFIPRLKFEMGSHMDSYIYEEDLYL